MLLKVKDIKRIMNEFAPTELKEDYDNVGLMVGDLESPVTSILVALDCTLEVIKEAKENGCNLILTHHPLIFSKLSSITTDTLIGRKIMELIKSDINVFSSHTNLDSTLGGINDKITEILGFKEWSIIEPVPGKEESGIGRLVNLNEPISLIDLCEKVKNSLELSQIRYSGKDDIKVKKLAIINGSGSSYLNMAKSMGANCIITGDTSYHYVSDFEEQNVGIIDAGHFDTEWIPMKNIGIMLSNILKCMGYTNKVIISEKCRNPYKAI